VKKYTGADWDNQLVKPKATLETITGKPVEYFAYPFGLWNEAAIPELKKRGYKAAYQLSDKRDGNEPYTRSAACWCRARCPPPRCTSG
jgi:peptidoglycan/xylan/chitin deacetylase (PgdA/CDA1 family)